MGSILGCVIASPYTDWLAEHLHPAIVRLPSEPSAAWRHNVAFGIWSGLLLASAPLAAMLSGRLSKSNWLLAVLLMVGVLAALSITWIGAPILAEAPPGDVVATFRKTDVSFCVPALAGIVATVIAGLVARLVPRLFQR